MCVFWMLHSLELKAPLRLRTQLAARSGVPFIMKAGKGLEVQQTIVRLQFKKARFVTDTCSALQSGKSWPRDP